MPGQKILVVDDDPNLLRLVELILRRAQYEVVTSSTGEIGIEKARDEKPDLILMDVMLPGIDGFQTTRAIRRLPECAQTPIIFLSASDSTESKVKGLRGGGNDYITKPVKTGELLARIEAHLRPSSMNVGQVITVFGCKPGVGVTTFCVNLALALQHSTQKNIIIIDWQRPQGDVAYALGMPEVRSLEFILSHAQNLDEEALANLMPQYTPGIWVIPGSTSTSVAAQMNRKPLTTLTKVAQLKADYVIIDAGAFNAWEEPPLSPRGEGLNVCLLTPDPFAIRRASQVADYIKDRDTVFWFIANYFPAAGAFTSDQIEQVLGTTLHGYVLNGRPERDHNLNAAPPYYQRDPQSDYAQAMERVADHIHKVIG
ncbi:MAG: response regulator [Anaerolineae bacterium]